MGKLLERKKKEEETLEDVKKVAAELTRKRLEEEFTLEDRAKYSNITAEGVTVGTLVSEAAETNPAEPGQVNVEKEREGANRLAGRDTDSKRETAKK